MAITTSLRQVGSTSVVSLSGKVTLGEASQSLRTTLEQLFTRGSLHIVLNLEDVPFIDSAGLGVLAVNSASAKAQGGALKLAAPQARVKDALELVRLNQVLPFFATEQEALDSFIPSDSAAPIQ
jgi:anti-sigma B factor antagonist